MNKQCVAKQRLKSLTKSQYFAIGLLIFFIIVTFFIYSVMSDWNNLNIELQRARTFHITFSYYFSGQTITLTGYIPDIQVDLTVHYQRGTLIVDDPVTISGIAIVNTSIPQQTRSITVHFQNAQAHPITQDVNNITEGADLYLGLTQNSSRLIGNSTMAWTLEGTYNPYFAVLFENSTGMFTTPLATSKDVAITVYPKSQFAQIVTNNVSMLLAIAVYLLTLVGTGGLVLSLWDRKPSSKEGEGNSEASKKNAEIVDNNTNKRVTGKASDNNTKSNNKQRT